MNTLSVCCPVYSEPTFMKLWLDSVLSYADEIIIINGCGDDETSSILSKYADKYKTIKLTIQPQYGQPYSNEWKENVVRTQLIEQATMQYVLMLDADEIMDDNFNKQSLSIDYFYGFKFIPFWRDIKTIRCNTKLDPHWYGEYIYRLFPRGFGYYDNQPHHCVLKSYLKTHPIETKIFHLHYAMETFKNIRKPHDNRGGEMGPIDAVDWEYGNKHPEIFGKHWSVKLRAYNDVYPKILHQYLENK